MSESTSADYRNADAFKEAEEGRRRDDAVAGASSGPVDEADMAAAEGLTATAKEAAAYRESVERGAHQKGEGEPSV
ncbi:MAG: hypothetical protein ACQSGP_03320 [Frankia sp.]